MTQGIPQVSPSAFLGQPTTITIQSEPGWTHTLTWQFADRGGTIGQDLGTEISWTPPLDLAAAIPNIPYGLCTITCVTFQGGAQVGTPQSVNVTLSVPQSLGPKVSAAYYDTSEAHDVFPFFLEKISRLWVVPEVQTQYGASVTGTGVYLDGKPYTSATMTSGYHILTVTATDSRGITGNMTYTVEVEAYTPPVLELTASRCLADGTADDTGDHARVTLTGSVTDLPGNLRELTLVYGKATVNVPFAGDTASVIIPADPEKTLSIRATLRDSLRSAVRSMTLSTAYATMDFLHGGKGIALGAVANAPGFHCAMDAQFSGKLTDGSGRELVKVQPLTPVEGLDMSLIYGRVLSVLDARTLQLQLTVTKEIPKGTQLFPGLSGLTKSQTVSDISGAISLKCSASQIQTNCPFPPGTYTFHAALY